MAPVSEFAGLKFECRDGTTDWNTISAIILHDEYGIADVDLKGKLVFDIGAHVGGLSIWAASRGATVVAVEPIPENLTQVYRNARLNNVEVLGLPGALGATAGKQRIRYGGADAAHAFIGNPDGNETSDREVWAEVWSIRGLVKRFGLPAVVKLDCEGGEWAAFRDVRLYDVPLVVGEWHPDGVHDQLDAILGETHAISFSGPVAGPGGFRAERLA